MLVIFPHTYWRGAENVSEEERPRAYGTVSPFPRPDKYTTEDWHGLLVTGGFAIRSRTQLRDRLQIFVTTLAGR